ncbi:hypothetical protein U0E23_04800 [Burkholderia stagnalis]|uniref:hypothetical protein n=1 Tax=Burkholderia stagnalis TaxID=1503054 RepID=UPI002AB3D44F|nr:hypothetical protein [Burkholderia stagnalis]MDY7801794.1 hypothetical protein [Burkholderia stagnalis]
MLAPEKCHRALMQCRARFQRMHAVSAARFATYAAFHPGCTAAYRDDEDIPARPARKKAPDAMRTGANGTTTT